jgi:hypothetical protein
MSFYKTSAVACQLGVPYYVLFDLVRNKRMLPPQKDSSGDYVWLAEDIERARRVLAARPRKSTTVGVARAD